MFERLKSWLSKPEPEHEILVKDVSISVMGDVITVTADMEAIPKNHAAAYLRYTRELEFESWQQLHEECPDAIYSRLPESVTMQHGLDEFIEE